jgi:hypothetical protein
MPPVDWPRLEDLKFLLTRETVTDPPQYYIASWQGHGKPLVERRLSNFPHPYPSLKVPTWSFDWECLFINNHITPVLSCGASPIYPTGRPTTASHLPTSSSDSKCVIVAYITPALRCGAAPLTSPNPTSVSMCAGPTLGADVCWPSWTAS